MFATQNGRSKPVPNPVRRGKKPHVSPDGPNGASALDQSPAFFVLADRSSLSPRINLIRRSGAANSKERTRPFKSFREYIDGGALAVPVTGVAVSASFEPIADRPLIAFFFLRADGLFDCEGHAGGRVFSSLTMKGFTTGSQRSRGHLFKQSIRVFPPCSRGGGGGGDYSLLCPRKLQSPPALGRSFFDATAILDMSHRSTSIAIACQSPRRDSGHESQAFRRTADAFLVL